MNVTIHKSDSSHSLNSLYNPLFSDNKQNRFTHYIINNQTDDIASWTTKEKGPTHLMARVMVAATNAFKQIANFFIKLANFIHSFISNNQEIKQTNQKEAKTPPISKFLEKEIHGTENDVVELDLEGPDFKEAATPCTTPIFLKRIPSAENHSETGPLPRTQSNLSLASSIESSEGVPVIPSADSAIPSKEGTSILFLDNKPFNSETGSITQSNSKLSIFSASSISSDQGTVVVPIKKEKVLPTNTTLNTTKMPSNHVSRAQLNAPKIKTRAATKAFTSTLQDIKARKDAKAAQAALAPKGKKQKQK